MSTFREQQRAKWEQENQERLARYVPMTVDELKFYQQKVHDYGEKLDEISQFVGELVTKGIVDEFN